MENEEKPSQTPLVYFLPVIFIIAVNPLVTFGKIVELPLEEANFWKGGTTHVDFFSYYKSTFLIIAACMALLSCSMLFLKRRIAFRNGRKYYLPMIVYSVFVVMSAAFSPHRNVALLGFIDMYQGMSVLLSYILLTFVMMNLISTERDLKIIINSFIILAAAVGILGLSQYFGHDLLQTDIGKNLITPRALEDADLKFSFGKYTIYATMYNTNFVGSYGALVLPLTVMLYLNADNKKTEAVFLISSIFAYTTWLGCNSRAGYLGIIAAVLVFIAFFRKIIKEKHKKIFLLAIIYISIAIIFNFVSGGRILGQFSRLSPLTEADKLKKLREEQKVRFEDIYVKDNTLFVSTNSEQLTVIADDSELTFRDGEGRKLHTLKGKNGNITFSDRRYRDYAFNRKEGFPFIRASVYGRPLNLYVTEDGKVKVISMNYKLTEPEKAPRVKLFDSRETFASNRGYIWSRAIPMLKNTLLTGYGPDNFCLMFPQEDYVGRFNTGTGMTDIVVDKPHNLFLQTAINTGVISLLALLSLWGAYMLDCIKLYRRRAVGSFSEYAGAAVFLSVTAYLTAGIFNDNIVSVAPLFWIMLGAGININRRIKIDNF